MSEQFDPYHEWLAIPPKDQPPNHYRLLGVDLFEENPNVSESAADRQMAHLRTFQGGRHAAESQKLLNEVATAKVSLLNAAKKAIYDAQLRQVLQAGAEQAGSAPEAEYVDPGMASFVEAFQREDSPSAASRFAKKPRFNPAVLVGGVALAVVVLGSVAFWWGSEKQEAGSGQPTGSISPPSPKKNSPVAGVDPKKDSKPPAPLVPPPAAEPKPQSKEEPKAPPRQAQSAQTNSPPKDAPAEKPEPKAEVPAKKIALPSGAEQERLIAAIDEVYKPGEAKDQAAKAALARKLLEEARTREANRSEQFVMFRRSGEIACEAGEAELLLEVVDAMMDAGFDVRPFALKARWLTQLAEQGEWSGTSQLSAFSTSCVALAEQAAAGDAVEEASGVLDAARKALAEPKKQAQQAYRKARASWVRARNPAEKTALEQKGKEAEAEVATIDSALSSLAECAKNLKQARRAQEAVQSARERLKTEPDNPEACLTVGRWACFYQGD
jgi:hypothetical protein